MLFEGHSHLGKCKPDGLTVIWSCIYLIPLVKEYLEYF